jgi:hypothetical protein
LGYGSVVAGIFISLGYGAASVGNWTPTFRDHYFASKHREQVIQGGGVIPQNNKFKYDKMDKTRKTEM